MAAVDYDKIPLLKKLNNYGNNGTRRGIRGRDVGDLVKGYKNLLSLIPDLDTAAIAEPLNTERIPLTHKRLKQFISREFDLCQFGLPEGCRVATLLPNGPELAVTMLSVVSRWCAAPINPTNSWQEIKAELESTRAQAIIILAGASANEAALEAATSLSIGVIVISPTGAVSGLFRMALLHKVPAQPAGVKLGYTVAQTAPGFTAYSHPETVLLLHTSGTSGNKKLVPYSLDMVIVGVGCIISSWALGPSDVCLNMMPLFHIGGIMRNVLSPVLSGGCVITCSGFDPLLFWDVLESQSPCHLPQGKTGSLSPPLSPSGYAAVDHDDHHHHHAPGSVHSMRVTWYYAAPTMHHAILMEAEGRVKAAQEGDEESAFDLKDAVASVRFIANAAGGLLPVLAESLRSTFGATILTSYGMTECMPISSPPQTYRLDPTGTSGLAVGPDVCIVDDDLKRVSSGVKGNILVRGPPCFGGYENNGSANDESFFSIDGEEGWFNTGDMGSLSAEGYLFISGRSKEIINRGGETISPFEIEEAVQQYPSVKEVLAFSAPHEQYQETVGCVIVTNKGMPRVDLPALHKFLEDKLHRAKWPFVLVYSDALPKNAANKILRIRYSERTRMHSIDEESSPLSRLFEAKCPKVGAPLTEAIALTPVTESASFMSQGAEQTLLQSVITLKSGRKVRVLSASVVAVNLPFRPDSYAAFVVLTRDDKATSEQKEEKEADGGLSWQAEAEAQLLVLCDEKLDCYLVPAFVSCMAVLPVLAGGGVDTASLVRSASRIYSERSVVKPRNAMESQIEAVWRQQLNATSTVSVVASFFDLGGDSLKAGQLINAMRKKLRVQLAVADLFTAPTIEALATKISLLKTLGSPSGTMGSPNGVYASGKPHQHDSKRGHLHDDGDSETKTYSTYETSSPFSNRSWGCLITQIMPLLIVFPIRRIVIWFLLASVWVEMMRRGIGRFHALVIAMLLSRLTLGVMAPLVGIASKWVIIGRYKAGKYPLWGSMYLRWWLVEQIVNILGKGFFKDDFPIIGSHLVRLYYVLMGATIGSNVKIHKDAKLGQADLLTIGNDTVIDVATIRPFSIEEGYFVLLPITIGDRCCVGIKTQIAAGATLPSGTCMGPLSSSHEKDDAEPHYRNYCRPAFQQPPAYLILFVGCPVLLCVLAVGLIPWYYALLWMVYSAKIGGWYEPHVHSVFQAFLWWITPQRLVFYFLLRIVRRCFVPFMRLFLVIVIKKTVIGKSAPSALRRRGTIKANDLHHLSSSLPIFNITLRLFYGLYDYAGKFVPLNAQEKEQPWNRFRYWLMSKLLPGGGLTGVARLVGSHYEIISVIYRLLGAKVGQRVYWPGSGLDIVEYDLLDVGDDVVFGSRSVVLTSSAVRSAPVRFESGSMVADRCVVLPGVILRRGAVLGSGSLASENADMAVGSVWVGSKDGAAVNVAPADPSYNVKDTISPFGRAFYQGQATYTVVPLWGIVLYNTGWQAFCTCFRNSPTALSLIFASVIMKFEEFSYSPGELFRITLLAFVPLHLFLCIFALSVDIASKWYLLGRRKQGAYPWDQSDYCQKWQIYLTLEEIRRGERRRTGVLDMLQGSQYLVWYFQCLGATIGRNVCLYPNGGDPMMTEPDLVTIGDDSSIDDASLIAHINTRGIYRLNPLTVGKGCVLKSGTRLLSGASMDDHSVMLEHTLVLAGEVVDRGMVWQGWPCAKQYPLESHRRTIRMHLDDVSLKRMAKREQSKRDEEMTAAALCWPCAACCCPSAEYDRLSLLEEAGSTNNTSNGAYNSKNNSNNSAKSDFAAFISQDKQGDLGVRHGSSRNLLHLKERSDSFHVQTREDALHKEKNKSKVTIGAKINGSIGGNGSGSGGGNGSVSVKDAEGVMSLKSMSVQPSSGTPLLGGKRGYGVGYGAANE